MKNKLIFFTLLTVSLIGLLINSACSSKQQNDIVIKAGYLAHPGYLPLFCADHLGIAKNGKVRLEIVRFSSSPAMISAFVNGEIQIAPVATVSALSLESLDPGKFKIFALSSETIKNYLTSIVILQKNSQSITSITDLKGKTVGLFPGPAARILFSLVFQKYGLVPNKDFILKELAPPLQLQALANGQVDALATYEPIATQAVMEINAIKIMPAAVESNVLTPTQGGSWLISSALIKDHPDVAKQIIANINTGIDFINNNQDSLAPIISEYASVKLNVAQKSPIVTYSKLSDINLAAFQKHADLMLANGAISNKIDVSKLLFQPN